MKEILSLYNDATKAEFRVFRNHIKGYLIEKNAIIILRENNTNLEIKNELPWDNWDEFIQDLRAIFTQEQE